MNSYLTFDAKRNCCVAHGSNRIGFWESKRKGGVTFSIVKGYELSEGSADFGRRKFGLDIESRSFPSDPHEMFDVVILTDVLEHLKEPGTTVANIF